MHIRNQDLDTPPRALSISSFCKSYNVSRAQTYKLIERGELVAVKMGSRTLIPVESAEAWFCSLPKLKRSIA